MAKGYVSTRPAAPVNRPAARPTPTLPPNGLINAAEPAIAAARAKVGAVASAARAARPGIENAIQRASAKALPVLSRLRK